MHVRDAKISPHVVKNFKMRRSIGNAPVSLLLSEFSTKYNSTYPRRGYVLPAQQHATQRVWPLDGRRKRPTENDQRAGGGRTVPGRSQRALATMTG